MNSSRPLFTSKRYIQLSKTQRDYKRLFLAKIVSGEYTMVNIPCLCGKNNDEVIADHDRYGLPLRTVICKECGMIRSNPYYDEATLRKFYQNEYRGLYSGTSDCTEFFFAQQIDIGKEILGNLEKCFENRIEFTGMRVFEIGCGAGGILQSFKEKGCDVYGVDYGDKYITFGRAKGLNVEKGSIDRISTHGNADIVILNHVLEHIVGLYSFLEKVRLLLKQDGILYIAVPSINSIPEWYGADVFRYIQNAHVWYFSETTLVGVIRNAGFDVIASDNSSICICKQAERSLPVALASQSQYHELRELLIKYERKYYKKLLRSWFATPVSYFKKIVAVILDRLRLKDSVKKYYLMIHSVYKKYRRTQ